jgi:hypothetical protein
MAESKKHIDKLNEMTNYELADNNCFESEANLIEPIKKAPCLETVGTRRVYKELNDIINNNSKKKIHSNTSVQSKESPNIDLSSSAKEEVLKSNVNIDSLVKETGTGKPYRDNISHILTGNDKNDL